MSIVRKAQDERVFTSVAFFYLALYVLFAVVVMGSVLFYTSPAIVLKSLLSKDTLFAIKLSLFTSVIATALAVIVAIPAGYCLSRYNFRGKALIEIIIDLPMTLPPLVIGLCLLIFFSTGVGRFLEENVIKFVFAVPGIILAQFSISASLAVVALKASYDSVDPRYEVAARTLGCNKVQAFFKITFPLVRTGIITGAVMTWTRAVGEFVPILLLCGAQKGKTEIMPIAIFMQFEQGDIEGAVALTIIFLLLSSLYLALLRKFGLRAGGGR